MLWSSTHIGIFTYLSTLHVKVHVDVHRYFNACASMHIFNCARMCMCMCMCIAYVVEWKRCGIAIAIANSPRIHVVI